MQSQRKLLETPLAVGATADVYAWETGWVLKLFRAGHPHGAETEARAAGAVSKAMSEIGTLSVPAVGSLVAIGERYGLLYQRIEGHPMLEVLMQTSPPPVIACAHQLAELHTVIHSVTAESAGALRELPMQRERLLQSIQAAKALSSPLRLAAQQALARLPSDQQQLCHGDFHPANVLLTASGEAVVIDWNDATRGDPLADVARTSLLVRLAAPSPSINSVSASSLEAVRRAFHEAYIERYFALRPTAEGQEQVTRWLPIIAAARLGENIAATEQATLLSFIEANFPFRSLGR